MNRRSTPALLALVLLAAACGASPSPSAPSPSVSSSSTSAAAASSPSSASAGPGTASSSAGGPSSAAAATPNPNDSPTPLPSVAGFSLTSPAFSAEGVIPARFTCDGRDVSPELTWSGAPAGTASFALIVDDRDAHAFAHWIVLSIPHGASRLAEGAGAAGSTLAQGTNDFGRLGWGGPCPPSGTHRYVFTLYALAAPLGLSGAPDGSAVRAALANARILGMVSLTAKYARGG